MPLDRTVRTYLLANLALVVVTAYFSVTYFHPDEHFQILEFVGHKLGTTAAPDMPWEFGARMRSWMQPAAYYALARAARVLGIRDVFFIAFLFRLASGVFGWFALSVMLRTTLRWAPDDEVRLAQLRATTLLGFLPFLAVRTSSENVSCSLASLAFCMVVDAVRAIDPGTTGAPRLPARAGLFAGLLFGLAFECRFQTAILAAGLFAWLWVFGRLRLSGAAGLFAGGAAAVALGLVVDRWGYGAWCFPAYAYLRVNLVDRVAATQFGSEPFYGYLYLLPANVLAPVVVVLMVAVGLTWARRPKHPVTWMTLPYALANCLLAHKEERFFFPMLLVSTSAVTLGLSPAGRTSPVPAALRWIARQGDAAARRIWSLRRSPLAALVVADNLAGMLLLAVYPLGWGADVTFYDYAYHHIEQGAHVWTRAGWGFPQYPFYGRGRWDERVPAGPGDVVEALRRGEPSYFVVPQPYENVPLQGVRARLVYSEFPGWEFAFVRGTVGPLLERTMRALECTPRAPKAKWLTVYRLESAGAASATGDAP